METAPPLVERRVRTPRLTLALRDHGGGGPPVLALHGLASNARWWDLVARELHGSHRVVAVDLRGHGLSDRPEHGYGYAEVCGDLSALLDELRLDRCVVAGHSWGASVALHLAAAEPDRVIGVVAVDGGVGRMRERLGTWETAQEVLRPPVLTGVGEDRVRAFARRLAGDEATRADVEAILLGNFEPDGPDGLRPRLRLDRHMEIARAMFDDDVEAVLQRIHVPVEVVLATDSFLSREEREAEVAGLLAGVDGARLRWVDGHHDLPVQRPREVADAIAQLCDRVVAG